METQDSEEQATGGVQPGVPQDQQIISDPPEPQQLQQQLAQQQQGTSATPKLQQIISAAVQKPQMVSVSPKLQQIVLTTPQGSSPSSKLQQIISAAVHQPNPCPPGTSQLQRIISSSGQGVIATSQLQQIISGSPQLQKTVVSSPRFQQVVVSSSQVLQTGGASSQVTQIAANSPHLQRIITTSAPFHTGVITSPKTHLAPKTAQVMQGMKTVAQVQQGVKQTVISSQLQQGIKPSVISSQLQQGIRQVGTSQQIIKTVGTTQLGTKVAGSSPQVIRTVGGSPQIIKSGTQQVIKPSTSLQVQPVIKAIVPSPSQRTIQVQQGGTASPQMLGVKASPQLLGVKASHQQQGVKASPQLQVVKASPQFQGVKASPQLLGIKASPQLQGVAATTSSPKQGVMASPRLPPAPTPTKKKVKPPKPTNLGEVIGKLTQGSRHVKRFKEDRRNTVKAVKPLTYGSFGSYAPSYDSSFANLTKEESDLINYSEFEPSSHIKNILAKETDYTFTLADSLIDIFSGSKEPKRLKLEKEESQDNYPKLALDPVEGVLPKSEEEELQTLSALGIDLTHLAASQDSSLKQEEGSAEVQQRLERTTNLLKRLQEIQYDRLSVPPHPRLGHSILPPSEVEVNLAKEITGNLTDLAKRVPPGALVIDRVCSLK